MIIVYLQIYFGCVLLVIGWRIYDVYRYGGTTQLRRQHSKLFISAFIIMLIANVLAVMLRYYSSYHSSGWLVIGLLLLALTGVSIFIQRWQLHSQQRYKDTAQAITSMVLPWFMWLVLLITLVGYVVYLII